MTLLQYATDASPGGALVSDDSNRATALSYATNMHGFAELRGHIPLALPDAFQRFDRPGLPHQRISDGPQTVYEGRLEDMAIQGDGVNATALGYSRCFSDAPYNALWSASEVGQWRPGNELDNAAYISSRFQIDSNNRLYMAPQKGATYANAGANFVVATHVFQIPDDSTRQIVGVSFDYVQSLPAGWEFGIVSQPTPGGASTAIFAAAGGIGVSTGNRFQTITAANCLLFYLYYNAAAAAFAGETGASYVIITNVRVVTSTANKVDTTATVAYGAALNTTITVGSTARMYVGQRVHLGIAAALGEGVIVKSITNSTQFVADTTAAGAIGTSVQAHVIYADEIVKDMVAATSTLNSAQLSSSTALIQSPALDLLNESYEDRYPSDILTYLAGLGDNQTTPRQWEWAVWENRQLAFQPQGYSARTWYIDLAAMDIERTLNALWNSVYADYQDAGGRTLRTAITSDATSIARYGLTRRKMISVSSTSATQAGVQQAAALADDKDPLPRAGITTEAVFDQNGARWPLTAVRANDTVIIRNLPPTLSTTIDRVRVFRLIRTDLNLITGVLTLEPESPLPTLAATLARAAAPAWVTTPWWVQIK